METPGKKQGPQKSSSPKATPLLSPRFHFPLTSVQLCPLPQAARQWQHAWLALYRGKLKRSFPYSMLQPWRFSDGFWVLPTSYFELLPLFFITKSDFKLTLQGTPCLDSWPSSDFSAFIFHSPTRMGSSLQLYIVPCSG